MIPGGSKFVEPMRCEMQIPADWIRDRLRLIVIIKAGEIAPAGITTQLDQARANHDSKTEPAKKPDHQNWRPAFRKGPPIKQRTKENGEKPGFEPLRLPAVAIPNLPDVNDGHVHGPENDEENCIRVSAKDN